MAVTPWPTAFADRAAADSASVSRAEVVAAVRAAEQSESWAEAFVATQVWGYGVTGYGPYRTRQVLAQPSAEAVLTEAVSLLVDEGAVAAYEVLHTLDGLGPAWRRAPRARRPRCPERSPAPSCRTRNTW
ncbi:two-component sensor protein histidine kinase [Streptomyces sp. CBMAI 2042]|uniref:8-oxoguanine DNA glycosylase OGG fold protein n=1 Tax=Streptomyces sp. CBMAI 2042 TaxID=2305222 RepID=UPI000F10EF49|nr:hypothetical protein [Streptomyces sp. CBMAI 2042]RLV70305.1 two-component sensor protein histidine kinase [Streptomyces sp. CBMAI 2042]